MNANYKHLIDEFLSMEGYGSSKEIACVLEKESLILQLKEKVENSIFSYDLANRQKEDIQERNKPFQFHTEEYFNGIAGDYISLKNSFSRVKSEYQEIKALTRKIREYEYLPEISDPQIKKLLPSNDELKGRFDVIIRKMIEQVKLCSSNGLNELKTECQERSDVAKNRAKGITRREKFLFVSGISLQIILLALYTYFIFGTEVVYKFISLSDAIQQPIISVLVFFTPLAIMSLSFGIIGIMFFMKEIKGVGEYCQIALCLLYTVAFYLWSTQYEQINGFFNLAFSIVFILVLSFILALPGKLVNLIRLHKMARIIVSSVFIIILVCAIGSVQDKIRIIEQKSVDDILLILEQANVNIITENLKQQDDYTEVWHEESSFIEEQSSPESDYAMNLPLFPSNSISIGSKGDGVLIIQKCLNV